MSTRLVYRTEDVVHARKALAALHMAGVGNDAISLVARSDVELEQVPDSLKEADTDAVPAAIRGMGVGGGVGLLAGLAAIVVAPVGITLAGAAAIGALGALVGGWSSALMGASLPDPVRQSFEDEIAAGRVLVLVDIETERETNVDDAMRAAGATRLEYAPPVGTG